MTKHSTWFWIEIFELICTKRNKRGVELLSLFKQYHCCFSFLFFFKKKYTKVYVQAWWTKMGTEYEVINYKAICFNYVKGGHAMCAHSHNFDSGNTFSTGILNTNESCQINWIHLYLISFAKKVSLLLVPNALTQVFPFSWMRFWFLILRTPGIEIIQKLKNCRLNWVSDNWVLVYCRIYFINIFSIFVFFLPFFDTCL
jgi:hypothetical protein